MDKEHKLGWEGRGPDPSSSAPRGARSVPVTPPVGSKAGAKQLVDPGLCPAEPHWYLGPSATL